jgi:hypothetical protein
MRTTAAAALATIVGFVAGGPAAAQDLGPQIKKLGEGHGEIISFRPSLKTPFRGSASPAKVRDADRNQPAGRAKGRMPNQQDLISRKGYLHLPM